MCYLPGSEGKGISDVLCGCADFTGKLPAPWYGSVKQIGTDECFLEYGYGLNYGSGFKARNEPRALADEAKVFEKDAIMAGTSYTTGLFKDGIYTNECAELKISIPDGLSKEASEDYVMSTPDYMNETDKKRIDATLWDADFMKDFGKQGDTDYISIGFMNTELAMPDNPDCTADDYLDAEDELAIRSVEDVSDVNVTFDDRGKVIPYLNSLEIYQLEKNVIIMLYLAMKDITKKWTGRRQDWSRIYAQLVIYYGDRIPE